MSNKTPVFDLEKHLISGAHLSHSASEHISLLERELSELTERITQELEEVPAATLLLVHVMEGEMDPRALDSLSPKAQHVLGLARAAAHVKLRLHKFRTLKTVIQKDGLYHVSLDELKDFGL